TSSWARTIGRRSMSPTRRSASAFRCSSSICCARTGGRRLTVSRFLSSLLRTPDRRMHPVLFDLPLGPLGSFTVGTYGLFYALGFLLALRLAVFYARRDGIEAGRILDLGIVGLLAGFVGAKLLLYALDLRYYLADPMRMVQNLRSAGVYYGGLGLAVLAGVVYVRRQGLPLGKVADLAAPALSLGQAIGRIGCFLAGCCYGRACDLPWGVTFHDPRAAELTGVPVGVRLHPTQ